MLECPEWDDNQTIEGNRDLFRQSIPDFPMLAKIFHSYEDYSYNGHDLESLRKECRLLLSKATDSQAAKAFRKLIYASDQAANAGCTFMLVCD